MPDDYAAQYDSQQRCLILADGARKLGRIPDHEAPDEYRQFGRLITSKRDNPVTGLSTWYLKKTPESIEFILNWIKTCGEAEC